MQQLFKAGHLAVAAAVTAAAVCASAVCAHVAIDFVGDYVLARDAYDGVAHGSRGEMIGVALLSALCVLLWLVRSAFDEFCGRRGTRMTVDELLGRGLRPFVFAVVALAVPVLAAMEYCDLAASGGGIDDAADLFGGSVALGLGMTIVIAASVAAIVRRIAKALLDSRAAFVAVIGQLFTFLARARANDVASSHAPRVGLRIGRRSILSWRFGKRGPPLPS